jgi:DNA-binding GntR family transcriptional regulator
VAQGPDAEIRNALTRNVDSSASALERGDLAAVAERLDEFDELLFSQLQNRMVTDLLERLQAHLKRIGQPDQSKQHFGSAVDEQRAILQAITARDANGAQDLLRRHLQHLLDDQLQAADTSN